MRCYDTWQDHIQAYLNQNFHNTIKIAILICNIHNLSARSVSTQHSQGRLLKLPENVILA